MAVLLGLAAGLVYGAADFAGGLVAKRAGAMRVVLLSQLYGGAAILAVLPLLPGAASPAALLWGAAAGVAGGAGVTLLYRGLAAGRMAVVSPVTAVGAASVPVVVALVLGEEPGTRALLGVVVALVAVVLVSASGQDTPEAAAPGVPAAVGPGRRLQPGLADAVGAGLAFALFFVLLAQAPADSGLWPLLGARAASVTVLAVLVLGRGLGLRSPGGTLGLMALAGVLDSAANLLYLLATRQGLLSLAVVLTSLYPAGTVLLARLVLRERIRPVQGAGLGLAAVGVVLITLG